MTADVKPPFCVGIDLGTTNCALAIGSLAEGEPAPAQLLPIPQVIQPGQVESAPLLPSFLYLPSEHELPKDALALPWDATPSHTAGSFARTQGARVPARLVSSAKSWLGVATAQGPHAAILPFGAPEGVERISPVEASTRYLRHLGAALDAAHGPETLRNAPVVLTVPASFDAGARDLTVEAARAAGVENLTLLEEPQAAVYAWVVAHGDAWRSKLSPGDVVLVVDVGGGTTDFSLVGVSEQDGNLGLQRLAVGEHILLGGDNMDLALAYALKPALENGGKTLDAMQFAALTHASRDAKEQLFARAELEQHPITVAGRGASLMASTLKTNLTRQTMEQVLVEGFFPVVDVDAQPVRKARAGLTTLGLPYAQDAAVTRHLAAFLLRQVGLGTDKGRFIHPTAVLFNGGVFKASALQQRVVEVLNMWLAADGAAAVRVLEGQDLDHAVARGAAAFGRVRAGGGIRIRGGTARSYYVGIEEAAPAVPGVEPALRAVCVAPFGMEEGSTQVLNAELGVITGEPARFRFFTATNRPTDTVGTQVTDWHRQLTELPYIEATAAGEPGNLVAVRVSAHVTPVGTLELSCVDAKGEPRARFHFNARAGT